MESQEEKGKLWWIADNKAEAEKWIEELPAKGCTITLVDPEKSSDRVHVIFELPKAKAKEILGYEPDEESWLVEDEDMLDDGPRP